MTTKEKINPEKLLAWGSPFFVAPGTEIVSPHALVTRGSSCRITADATGSLRIAATPLVSAVSSCLWLLPGGELFFEDSEEKATLTPG